MKRRFLAGFIIGLGLILLLTYAMSQKWLTPLTFSLPFTSYNISGAPHASPAILDIGTTTYVYTLSPSSTRTPIPPANKYNQLSSTGRFQICLTACS